MPSDRERGGLLGIKRPLVAAEPITDREAERAVLPAEVTERPLDTPAPIRVEAAPKPPGVEPPPAEEPTKPATFHLPVTLLQRLRATCRLKNTTMVDFVRRAVEDALERQRPTEEEIRKLLG